MHTHTHVYRHRTHTPLTHTLTSTHMHTYTTHTCICTNMHTQPTCTDMYTHVQTPHTCRDRRVGTRWWQSLLFSTLTRRSWLWCQHADCSEWPAVTDTLLSAHRKTDLFPFRFQLSGHHPAAGLPTQTRNSVWQQQKHLPAFLFSLWVQLVVITGNAPESLQVWESNRK
jgi:hypothetical protein